MRKSRDELGRSTPDSGHYSARSARQKSATSCREQMQQMKRAPMALFDHLVGAGEQARRDIEAEHLRSF
jgi:hypothetical protein